MSSQRSQRLTLSRYGWVAVVLAACVLVGFASQRSSDSERPQSLHVPVGRADELAKVDVSLPADFYSKSVVDFYKPYRDEMFAHWTCLNPHAEPDSLCKRPITDGAITALEYLASGGAYRIRFDGTTIRYRPLQVFGQAYKTQRLEWIMNTMREIADEGLLTRTVGGKRVPIRFDAVFRTGDSPQVTKDTMGKDSGYLLFSLRSSKLHFDIPIPDPVGYGSNGNYVWPPPSELVPWEDKVDKVVFRGSASFSFAKDNWHSNNRFRAAQLSDGHPDLFDMGMTLVRPKAVPPITGDLHKSFYPQPSADDILAASGIELASSMTFYEQSRYKYIIDINGGLGSSRRIAMLQTGSVPLLTESSWFCTHDRLLVPWVHYVPIAEDLSDLIQKVRWLRAHDDYARQIVENAAAFAQAYLTKQAAKEQLAAILERYSELQAPDVKFDDSPVEVDFCKLTGAKNRISPGPMGCSRGWKTWEGSQ